MKRDNHYDLLRIVSCAMVVLLHAGAFYVSSANRLDHIVGVICQGITRTAVPCFVMLSGAFLLNDQRYRDTQFVIKKTKNTILIPTLVYSVGFILFSFLMYWLGFTEANYLEVILLAIKGYPYPHMWYMYMCIGLYLATPYLWKIKEEWGGCAVPFFLIFGYVIQRSSDLFWPIKFIPYIGYFLFGGYIRTVKINSAATKYMALCLWWIAITASCCIQIFWPDSVDWWGVLHTDPLNPIVMIASLSCFVYFTSLETERDYYKISKHTDDIYFIHIVFQQIIWTLGEKWFPHVNVVVKIGGIFTLSFIFSYIYSLILKRMLKQLANRKAL